MIPSCKLFDSIDQVPPADWNTAAGDSSSRFMDPQFLRAVERTVPESTRVFQALIYEADGRPGACASLCLMPVDLFLLAGPRVQAAGEWGRTLLPNLGKVNVLLCGLPVSLGQSHLAFARGADRARAVALLDTLMSEIARCHGARQLAWKEFGDEDRDDLDLLCRRGYCRVESPATYEMAHPYPNFAAFCDDLRSHNRGNIRRSQQKFARAGCRAVHLEHPEAIARAYTPEVHGLYEAVVARSDVKLEVLPLSFFHELARQLPGQVTLTALYRKERIVAFGWGLAAGPDHQMLFCGVDYAQNCECDLYFNVIYHSFDRAFQCGAEVLHVGQTADDFKTRLGCTGKARHFYVRGSGPILSWLLRQSAGLLFPSRPPLPSRDVFKSARTAAHTSREISAQ
jgi:predicted N-acyltransferase